MKKFIAKLALALLRQMGVPLLIHQPRYSMLDRTIEKTGLVNVLREEGVGCICFSPLAQGMLSGKYNDGIPADSRAASPSIFLNKEQLDEKLLNKVRQIGRIAGERGQTTAQLALSWALRLPEMTSVLIGASKVSQLEENIAAVGHSDFTAEELERIEEILRG